ncbi:MAG: DEAD/DEAH box helicase family protein [Syntrophorhabdales bacterium]|nr:DEAD/DEAH box helicase family protein [Syntrophorhabdales bacterium]
MKIDMNVAPQQYLKLEHRLTLLAWLGSLLGYGGNKDMLADTKNVAEGFDASGRSFMYYHLIARGGKVKIAGDDLERYDANLRAHLEKINRHRAGPVTLRYFQYLAALLTEIVLDRLFNHRAQLLKDLNAFVRDRNTKKLPTEPPDDPFTEADLSKLAYWMATGSGKTLILHLNYHQFLCYNPQPLDNILLITPNEGLSEQHLAELAASGIPARRFDLNHSGLWGSAPNAVQVIEITKLVEEKRGGGVSVPVEAFEGRNLIFVDEGHKGSGGEAWRKYRDALGQTGFTFEYSATFGQALNAARNDPLTAEYGKAILFDYSYRYFYGDGYGKDFRILNLRDETDEAATELLLLGNLLSFYEQQRVFEEQAEALRPYNLEKPLWVFVGSTVNAVYSENRQKRSDVLTVARFLHHVLENKRGWVIKGIGKLLAGKSGLVTPDGMDLFAGRFKHLEETGLSAQALYADILKRLFHAPAGGSLHLCAIRAASGELGLKATGAEDYFGLIYIGDVAEFKKLVEADSSGMTLEEDALSPSLFGSIGRPDTSLAILIGAKKFMEGWNSWRVSNMGLLNIGRQEGSQIIQLFGRGVRLKGKGMSLRRSAAVSGTHPAHIKLLETLNIFAVRANYMAQFRDYLEREGVETEPVIELPLFVWANEQFLQKGLVVPRPEEGRDFAAETALSLAADPNIRVQVDLSLKVQALESAAAGLHEALARGGARERIETETLALVDWEQAYLAMLGYKARKGWNNLIIRPESPRAILETVPYTLIADDAIFQPRTLHDRSRLQEAVAAILRKYMDAYCRRCHEQWDSQHLVYRPLNLDDPNLAFNRPSVQEKKAAYTVRVPGSRQDLIETLEKLRADMDKLINEENSGLPRIHFDRSLYLPLLLKRGDQVTADPPPLEESEAQFVRNLRAYWEAEKDKSLAGKEVYLLRNLSRGKGVGFFEESGFYPDFILWIVEGRNQRIVFIEPHGMLRAKAYIHDEKARLWERLPELAQEIGKRSEWHDIELDSYIISATSYDDLYQRYDNGRWTKEDFAQKHILFPERNPQYDYLRYLLSL